MNCVQETTTLKKGFKIGGTGAGKVVLCEGESHGIKFDLPHGDKTLIEVQSSSSKTEDDAAPDRFKQGTFYMIAKELSKSLVAPLLMTGYKVEATSGGGQHGYKLTAEKSWKFQGNDKQSTSFSSGNILASWCHMDMQKVKIQSPADWQWRFSWDQVHSKLTCKKPFLILSEYFDCN